MDIEYFKDIERLSCKDMLNSQRNAWKISFTMIFNRDGIYNNEPLLFNPLFLNYGAHIWADKPQFTTFCLLYFFAFFCLLFGFFLSLFWFFGVFLFFCFFCFFWVFEFMFLDLFCFDFANANWHKIILKKTFEQIFNNHCKKKKNYKKKMVKQWESISAWMDVGRNQRKSDRNNARNYKKW